LLVETVDRWIHAEPMKGTAAPGQRAALEASVKDQAELAMITDLTRNDLQQLCVRGTVRVPAARRFLELPYVVQAVSDVEGQLREGVTLAEVVRVMHPGGSVTGAPRPAAMAVIRELESSPRRFYCGTLGLERGDRFRAALLIRTATLLSARSWEYGVGGGITWDSDPKGELDEVRLKLGALGQS
jgi:anthranilate/para-aminobenzoate synthase component I